MTHDQPTIFAVGGVVYRRTSTATEILLIKKEGGFWTLPKGQVKKNEANHDALAREIEEETGIVGTVEGELDAVAYNISKNRKTIRKMVTYYLFQATGGTLRPDKHERIAKVRWFPIDKALGRIRRKRVRTVAQHAALALQASAPNQ